jgi:hypothetical protein
MQQGLKLLQCRLKSPRIFSCFKLRSHNKSAFFCVAKLISQQRQRQKKAPLPALKSWFTKHHNNSQDSTGWVAMSLS